MPACIWHHFCTRALFWFGLACVAIWLPTPVLHEQGGGGGGGGDDNDDDDVDDENEDDDDDPDAEDLILSLRNRETKQIRTKLTRTSVSDLESLILRAPTIQKMGWEPRRIMRINEI